MAAFNAAGELPDQLRSLVNQTYVDDWEVVIADDGSTDRTREVVASWQGRFSGLKLIDASARSGQAQALNAAVRAARGELLVVLDADDEVSPNYLEVMADALRSNEFVASRLDCAALNPEWVQASRPPVQTDDVGVYLGFLPAAAGASLAFHRSVFDAVGGFDESLPVAIDIDFCWKHVLGGGDITFARDAVVRYRYRRDIRGIFRQGRWYGAAGPLLYERYRSRGMPRRSLHAAARFWASPAVKLLKARTKGDFAALAFMVGFRMGIMDGCRRSRLLFS